MHMDAPRFEDGLDSTDALRGTPSQDGRANCSRDAAMMRKELRMIAGLLRRLLHAERGQDTAEYGIALAVIGLVAGLVALAIAQNTGSLWSKANSLIQTAVDNP